MAMENSKLTGFSENWYIGVFEVAYQNFAIKLSEFGMAV